MVVINTELKNNKISTKYLKISITKAGQKKLFSIKWEKTLLKICLMKLNNHFVELRYTWELISPPCRADNISDFTLPLSFIFLIAFQWYNHRIHCGDHWNLQNSLFLENVKWTPKSDKNSYSILIVNFHLLGKVSKWNLSGHLLHEPLIDKRRKQLITTMADFSSLMGAGICIGKFIVLVQIF